MGIAGNTMEALLREGLFRPFRSVAYTLGRATMDFSPEETNQLFKDVGVTPNGGWATSANVDITTTGAKINSKKTIRDIDYFRMLGFNEVRAVDFSDFEG